MGQCQTEIWRQSYGGEGKSGFITLPGKEETQEVSASRTVLFLPYLVRGYIVWGGVCEKDQGSKSLVFFLLQSFKMARLLSRIGCMQGLR